MFQLTIRQWQVLRALTTMEYRDAQRGDLDRGLVEQGLIDEQPTADELRVLADVVADEADKHVYEPKFGG